MDRKKAENIVGTVVRDLEYLRDSLKRIDHEELSDNADEMASQLSSVYYFNELWEREE